MVVWYDRMRIISSDACWLILVLSMSNADTGEQSCTNVNDIRVIINRVFSFFWLLCFGEFYFRRWCQKGPDCYYCKGLVKIRIFRTANHQHGF